MAKKKQRMETVERLMSIWPERSKKKADRAKEKQAKLEESRHLTFLRNATPEELILWQSSLKSSKEKADEEKEAGPGTTSGA